MQNGNQLSTTYRGAGAAAIPFDRARRLVLLSRVAAEGIVGEHPFYFAPALGGTHLRAYNYQQLAGEASFVNSNDLRLDVYRFKSGLPGTIGVNLGLDHGRVFGPTIPDDTWHLNYGGGVWWSIVDEIGISAGYFRGLDGGERFTFQIGPLFANTGL
ncbi:MAG: metallophosphatase [Myxococcaceae bacterium]|nr:metallophosphatase [Myxococcaceae bacterium]